MSGISLYLLSVLVIAVLIVVIDIILPNGEIAKYIKSISSIFMLVVICVPIVNLLKDFSLDNVNLDMSYDVDYNYLNAIHLKEADCLADNLKTLLKENGCDKADIVVNIHMDERDMKISNIFVDLSKAVLNKNIEHINNYTTIKELIAEYCSIEEAKIFLSD